MMPVIRISDGTFSNLKTLSVWLSEPTPGAVISRLVEDQMQQLGIVEDGWSEEIIDDDRRDGQLFLEPPGLTHTKVLKATVDGVQLASPNWVKILIRVIELVIERGPSGPSLVKQLGIPATTQKKTDQGYKYYAALGVSIQGQSAPDAWREASRLASKFSIPVDVEFRWREKRGAQHPGRTGSLSAGKR